MKQIQASCFQLQQKLTLLLNVSTVTVVTESVLFPTITVISSDVHNCDYTTVASGPGVMHESIDRDTVDKDDKVIDPNTCSV